LEEDLIRWIGNQLNASFNMDEIKGILTKYLPAVNIQECYLSIYEKDTSKASLTYALNGTYAGTDQKIIYPSKDLIPGRLPSVTGNSYCILPLESEHEQIGFEIFKLSDTNGKKYQNIAEKVASAFNISKLIDKISQQNLALRKSEENLRITLNSIGDAVITTDAEGKITGMNPVAELLTGWELSYGLGSSMTDIFRLVDAKSFTEIDDPVRKVLQTGNVVDLDSDTVLLTKDRKERRIAISGSPIRNARDEIVGVVLIFRDITEQQKMEEELRQAQKMDSIEQLAGGVAHDFNNMLAGMSGAAELIAFRTGKDEKIAKFIDMILDTARRAADLNQKLLAFSRKGKTQYVAVNVHDCVMDTVKILEHSIDRRVTITMELKADIATVKGDLSQIQNIVLNLGLNARDAMQDGGELTIASSNVDLNNEYCRISQFNIEPGPFVEISVRDTGTGISREIQEQIFDPFFTTKEIGKGTGLGLSAVYGMVCDHKGAIEVISKPEKGTLFKIYLPTDASAVITEKTDKDKIITGKGCILIVDDETVVVETLRTMLTDLGYELLTAEDGAEGVRIYEKYVNTIDLVILDMIMPKMSGYDTFKAMKKINPDVKILLSSGFTRDANMEELQQKGAMGFIQKPYSYAKLSKILATVLKK
jgi:PAS domain S-box-containing protein